MTEVTQHAHTYEKPIANILLNGKRLRAFPLGSRTRKKNKEQDKCVHSHHSIQHIFNIMQEVLAGVIRQKRNKSY